jgi:hypothetical protein
MAICKSVHLRPFAAKKIMKGERKYRGHRPKTMFLRLLLHICILFVIRANKS